MNFAKIKFGGDNVGPNNYAHKEYSKDKKWTHLLKFRFGVSIQSVKNSTLIDRQRVYEPWVIEVMSSSLDMFMMQALIDNTKGEVTFARARTSKEGGSAGEDKTYALYTLKSAKVLKVTSRDGDIEKGEPASVTEIHFSGELLEGSSDDDVTGAKSAVADKTTNG